MRIAIVGTGISGLTVASELAQQHDITLYEANDYAGGHSHTHAVEMPEGRYLVDSGFMVYNEPTYPEFTRLLDRYGIKGQPAQMTFSFKDARTGLEYNGHSFNTLFAQRKNLLNPRFYRMVADLARFGRQATKIQDSPNKNLPLRTFLQKNFYSEAFIDDFLLPLGAAVWCTNVEMAGTVPALYFINFFKNHGLFKILERPQWLSVPGGAKTYVDKILEPLQHRLKLNSPVHRVSRNQHQVEIQAGDEPPVSYDHVVIAAHADEALAMLEDPSDEELSILCQFPYHDNELILHTDRSLMPSYRRAWGSWNYFRPKDAASHVKLTYYMNNIQAIEAPHDFFITLNQEDEIDPEYIIKKIHYTHPAFVVDSFQAQTRWEEINGMNRTWYCGAYWGYGFHEDGVTSALKVVRGLGN